jgi:CubicO group peptidase (beta-lactamase class C family)
VIIQISHLLFPRSLSRAWRAEFVKTKKVKMPTKSICIAIAVLSSCFFLKINAQVKTLSGRILSSDEIDRFIQKQMDSLKIPAISFAIIQEGKVVYYKATGVKNYKGELMDSSTLFEAASMTKPVFAYAVHKLVCQGLLSLDTPLYRYYPYDDIDYDDRYKLITARMVLSHTSGFPNWRPCGSCDLTIRFEPGTNYGYSGEGFEYLGFAVKHRLNRKLEDVVAQEVFRPLGMDKASLTANQYVSEHLADGLKDNTEWGWNNRSLKPNVSYSLYTDAKEYSKFVIHLMKESHIPGSAFQQMSIPQTEAEPGKWACLGLFMRQTPYGLKYSHSGNNNNRFNSNFEFYKDRDLGYVLFINCHQEPALTKRLNQFLESGS